MHRLYLRLLGIFTFCLLIIQVNSGNVKQRVKTLEDKSKLFDEKLKELNEKVKELDARRTSENRTVAFMACITQQFVTGLTEDTRVIFDSAITNIGSAYNPTSGIFTAPHTGLYMFNLIGMAGGGKFQYLKMNVHGKNGDTQPGRFFLVDSRNSKDWPTATKMWILHLDAKDQVSILAAGYGSSDELYGKCYTAFYGVLLSVD